MERVANVQRVLPAEDLHPTAPWISDAFPAYARPLLGGPFLEYGRREENGS